MSLKMSCVPRQSLVCRGNQRWAQGGPVVIRGAQLARRSRGNVMSFSKLYISHIFLYSIVDIPQFIRFDLHRGSQSRVTEC